MTNTQLASTIRARRLRRDLTQQQLPTLAGLAVGTLRGLERGATGWLHRAEPKVTERYTRDFTDDELRTLVRPSFSVIYWKGSA